ncbi:helix-turn-helix domain-containing protein [Kitasatospora sp. HPMI-4]|uniref:AraC family transcriptional regulator n=1 Tax=Kitasatospora sp. HPMI-4 TaxID=3448443 RepID=UPI003F1CF181
MQTDGETARGFVIREGYARYQGPLADSRLHRHAAFQVALAVADGSEVTITDATGAAHRGVALLVPPMVRHRMAPTPAALSYFVDPRCAFADRLRAAACGGITVVPHLCDLAESELRPAGVLPSAELDERLRAAMDALTVQHELPLHLLAARLGLSPQRLRALAQQQLGLPLTRWRIWLRLARATNALGRGRTLAEAALDGGFADQAHFGRQMREMMGVTPSAVRSLLRERVDQARRAT